MMKSIFIAVLFLCGCSSGAREKSVCDDNTYFPLQVGNVWDYKLNQYSLSISVTSISEINGRQFAVLENVSLSNKGNPVLWTRLLRCNEKKNIEVMISNFHSIRSKIGSSNEVPDSGISVWYKFDANVNESWSAFGNAYFDQDEIHKFKIDLLSKTDTVFTNDTTYTNCYKFYIDDLTESDTEYFEWFAKDVGLVRRVFQNETQKGLALISFNKGK